MARDEHKPVRRLRLARTPAADTELPRVMGLEALLREVDDLRLTLETDLSLAASAVELGSPDLAAEILGHDRDALHAFEARALDQLGALDGERPRRRAWANVHAVPIVAAAALVGVLAGVVPHAVSPDPGATPTTVAATNSLERLQQLAVDGSPAEVRAASVQLHAQLASIVANARRDPAAAQAALLLLTYEQSAIVGSGDSLLLADVLRQSQALASAIRAALPAADRPAVPGVSRPSQPPTSPTPSTSASPKPAPKPSASPGASTGPQPSSSPSAQPYPTLPSPPLAP